MRAAIICTAALLALSGCAQVTSSRRDVASPVAVQPAAATQQPERRDFTAVLADGQLIVVDNPYGDVRLRFGGFAQTLEINAVLQNPSGIAPIALQPGETEGRYLIAPRLPPGAIAA